ncbi:universal stress protein YxiE [Paenibacillus sp. J31TS4]|uniref:universal stress protein n=1 Tax=Paenibacillus sp. J31TS4 TaxID=2807195 RepID=UPI001B2EB18A|nr:universal stress protein [Paenibacillus sp. J31TS4]GIP37570.1 universal stress protein YxiE [Paenibacillus sp. J31TS4]
MLFTNILVAFDGSEPSSKALDKAIAFCREDASVKLHVLHIMNLRTMIIGEAMITPPANYEADLMKEAEEIAEEANRRTAGLPNAQAAVVYQGPPAKTILEYAKEQGCDLIVIGNRGHSGFTEMMLGSVSHNVAQHSPIPVLIVK